MEAYVPKMTHYRQKTCLYRQQDHHPWVYQIDKGFVLIDGINADGKHGITDLYGAGNWFGPGLFDGIALQNATAHQDCVLERIGQADFLKYLAQDTELAQSVIQQISRREQHLQHRLFLQQTSPLPGRLAQLLRYLFHHQGQLCQHGHDRDIYLSQQELADMAGGSRQSVSQLLSDWKKQGAIDYTRGYICLEDSGKLQQLSEP